MPRHSRLLAVGLALLPLAGCDALFGPDRGREAQPELTSLPRSLSAAEQQVIRASNGFAFDLLREVVTRSDSANVFLSPLSASMALGMTMNGARGETLDGMRSALGFGDLELARINESYRDLIALLRGLDDAVDMRIANSVWARAGFPFHDAFLQDARNYFGAEVTALDFGRSDAAATINRWVDRNTAGRIREIVESPIDPEVVMYLINAIYFNGDWRHRFERGQTQNAPFTLADGTTTTVRMMNRTGPAYAHGAGAAGAQVLEQVYGRSAFAMTIVLPPDGVDAKDFAAQLDTEQWDAWIGALRNTEVRVAMPRFRLEYGDKLNDPLIALGMDQAFRPYYADFTGMSPLGRDLYISAVRQKTFLDVHEEGTEAAAVTSVEMRVVSADPAPLSFVVDRPFVLAIRERLSGTILFIGVIGHPRAP